MIGVNLTGVFNTFSAVLPHMIERGGGRLIATSSSVAGLRLSRTDTLEPPLRPLITVSPGAG